MEGFESCWSIERFSSRMVDMVVSYSSHIYLGYLYHKQNHSTDNGKEEEDVMADLDSINFIKETSVHEDFAAEFQVVSESVQNPFPNLKQQLISDPIANVKSEFIFPEQVVGEEQRATTTLSLPPPKPPDSTSDFVIEEQRGENNVSFETLLPDLTLKSFESCVFKQIRERNNDTDLVFKLSISSLLRLTSIPNQPLVTSSLLSPPTTSLRPPLKPPDLPWKPLLQTPPLISILPPPPSLSDTLVTLSHSPPNRISIPSSRALPPPKPPDSIMVPVTLLQLEPTLHLFVKMSPSILEIPELLRNYSRNLSLSSLLTLRLFIMHTKNKVAVRRVFSGVGCHRIANNVYCGASDLVSFGAQNTVAIFSPKSAHILTTLHGHIAVVNFTHWLPTSKFLIKFKECGQHYFLSRDADGSIIFLELFLVDEKWRKLSQEQQPLFSKSNLNRKSTMSTSVIRKLDVVSLVLADIDIAKSVQPVHIDEIVKNLNLTPNHYNLYRKYKAKVLLWVLDDLEELKNVYYVVVGGITPTPLGEVKSNTTDGLCQALGAFLDKKVVTRICQPSQGPTFGIKGGVADGGYRQVIPMDEFYLHLTGDIHAITATNNLLATAIDAQVLLESTQSDKDLFNRLCPANKEGEMSFNDVMFRRLKKLDISNPDELTLEEVTKFAILDIDPDCITWRRVMDINDRFLRKISVGQRPDEKGMVRETAFDISVTREIMIVLALTIFLADMREKLWKMVIGNSRSGDPITADDLGVGGGIPPFMAFKYDFNITVQLLMELLRHAYIKAIIMLEQGDSQHVPPCEILLVLFSLLVTWMILDII